MKSSRTSYCDCFALKQSNIYILIKYILAENCLCVHKIMDFSETVNSNFINLFRMIHMIITFNNTKKVCKITACDIKMQHQKANGNNMGQQKLRKNE